MFVLAEGDKKSSCLQYQIEGAVCLVQTFYQSCVVVCSIRQREQFVWCKHLSVLCTHN